MGNVVDAEYVVVQSVAVGSVIQLLIGAISVEETVKICGSVVAAA